MLQATRKEVAASIRDAMQVQVTAEFARSYVPGHVPNDTAQLSKKARKKSAKESRRAARYARPGAFIIGPWVS